jgi:hypothetical protein
MPKRPRAPAASSKSGSAPKNGRRKGGRRASATAGIGAIVSRTVADLVSAIEKHMRGNVADEVRAFIAAKSGTAARVGKRGGAASLARKRILPCIAPGCTITSKGPRFHYLCEKHMSASKKDYEAWRLRAKEKKTA